MELLLVVVGAAVVAGLAIESTPHGWRKAIGGLILLSALLLGFWSDH